MRSFFRATLRFFRLLIHFVRGLWLIKTRAHRPPAQQTEIVRHWLATVPLVLGVQVRIHGVVPEPGAALWVANHISWLDIPLLGGLAPEVVFLAKNEIRHWPIIGTLATGAGTLYMQRGQGSEAAYQAMVSGLINGRRIALFPEGTTTLGNEVRRFHPRLFQAAMDQSAPIQPITIRYRDTTGCPARSAAYIDDDGFMGSLWRVMTANELIAEVHFAAAQPPDSRRDATAERAESAVRAHLFRD